MQYNFDEVIDRKGTRCAKYDERIKKFGTEDLIPLWISDMDFKTAQPIIDACKKRAEEGIFGYTSRPDSYFEAVQNWEKERYDWCPDTALMSWSLGVVQSLTAIVRTFSHVDDKILIQSPVYTEFWDIPDMAGRKVLANALVEKEDRWQVDFADFEEKAKEAKIFILCNPHNPLGLVWEKEELQKMIEICHKHHVLVVSDEIHSDLIFHGKKHLRAATVSPLAKETVITCVSLSKTFNLAGLQASTTIFPNQELKKDFDLFWTRMDIHRNNAFSSVAMEAAYREGGEWLSQLLPYLEANLSFVADFVNREIPKLKVHVPDATYLMLLDCRGLGMNDKELNDFMVHKAKIGLNAGVSFGKEISGFMRLNVACSRKLLEQGLIQLRDAVASL